MISQILDVGTGQNAFIIIIPPLIDNLLILVFSLVGGLLGWWFLSPWKFRIVTVTMCGSIFIISFAAFQFNIWVSFVPFLLALFATSCCVWGWNRWIRKMLYKTVIALSKGEAFHGDSDLA